MGAAGAGAVGAAEEELPLAAPAPVRSIASTSKGTPAARRAWVSPSAGAEASAWGNRIVTRYEAGREGTERPAAAAVPAAGPEAVTGAEIGERVAAVGEAGLVPPGLPAAPGLAPPLPGELGAGRRDLAADVAVLREAAEPEGAAGEAGAAEKLPERASP